MRTTSHTRVGGRAEVSVGGRVEVRRALGRARVRRAESINLECVRVPVIYMVNRAEYAIRILVAVSHEYVNTYSIGLPHASAVKVTYLDIWF